MAYSDAGPVNTGGPTKTSWGNQVRNNQEDFDPRISSGEASIASHQNSLVSHDGRITTLEGASGVGGFLDATYIKAWTSTINTDNFMYQSLPATTNFMILTTVISYTGGATEGKMAIINTHASVNFQTLHIRGFWHSHYDPTNSHMTGDQNCALSGSAIPYRTTPICQHHGWYNSQVQRVFLHGVTSNQLALNHYPDNWTPMPVSVFVECYHR